jgi:Fe2+ or Zn2+ uptake regulation protein
VTDARAAVLELLLERHPALLSTEEIIRAMTAGSESFEDRDQVEVALRELVEAGLAHRVGSFAFASHAAANFDRLWAA